MAQVTLLDLQKLRGNDAVVGLIEENIKYTPELEVIPSRPPIRGTSYTTGIRTGLPTVNFRAANEGVVPSKSSFRQALVQCFIIDSQIQADKAVADSHEDGPAAWQAMEASGVMRAALRKVGTQVFYGVTADTKGFPGMKAFTPFGGTTAYGDALTINATGTTASTASSVYAVVYGNQDVTLVPGNGTVMELGDWRIQTVQDGNTPPGNYTAYVNGLTAWIGLQIGNENSVRRIANLTADSGKGLTDVLLARLLETFPSGVMPDAFFMSRRSRSQLQQSRTVVLQGNARVRPDQPAIAPIPTEYEGIPIIATDSILNTDAIES